MLKGRWPQGKLIIFIKEIASRHFQQGKCPSKFGAFSGNILRTFVSRSTFYCCWSIVNGARASVWSPQPTPGKKERFCDTECPKSSVLISSDVCMLSWSGLLSSGRRASWLAARLFPPFPRLFPGNMLLYAVHLNVKPRKYVYPMVTKTKGHH